MKLKNKNFKNIDPWLLILTLILSVIGIVAIKSATLTLEKDYNLKVQIIATLLGLLAVVIILVFGYEFLGRVAWPIYILSIGLLLATHFYGFGEESWGAKSWLRIPGLGTFQPAEFAKIGILIFLAKYISDNQENINDLKTLVKVLLLAFFPIYLVYIQPDLGTSVVFLISTFVMLFVAGLDYKYIFTVVIGGLILMPLFWIRLNQFQKNRILSFLNPELDPTGTGYQSIESKIAIGSGQLFGRGLFNGGQTQYGFLPEKHTDFIFAVIGEELGFIGGLTIIILYFFLFYRMIKIAKKSNDPFGKILIIGIFGMMLAHVFENIAMTIGLMPITGIPLPFLSYGGTFQLINYISIGIVLSVGLKKDVLDFTDG